MDDTTADHIREASAYLQDARQAHGMTQAALAERIGVTANVIAVYESGTRAPYPKLIEDLSQALGFDADEVYAILHRAPPDLVRQIGQDLGSIKAVRTTLAKRAKGRR